MIVELPISESFYIFQMKKQIDTIPQFTSKNFTLVFKIIERVTGHLKIDSLKEMKALSKEVVSHYCRIFVCFRPVDQTILQKNCFYNLRQVGVVYWRPLFWLKWAIQWSPLTAGRIKPLVLFFPDIKRSDKSNGRLKSLLIPVLRIFKTKNPQ